MSVTDEQARALVVSQARVQAKFMVGTDVQAEGVVVGYLDHPSLVIRLDDGRLIHVSVNCPLIVLDGPA